MFRFLIQKIKKKLGFRDSKKNVDKITIGHDDDLLITIIEAINNVINECKIIDELFQFKSGNEIKSECLEIINKCFSKSYFILHKIYKLKAYTLETGIKIQEPSKPLKLPIVQRSTDYLSKLSIDNLANETFKLHSRLTICLPNLKEIYDLTMKKDLNKVKRIRETDL